MQDYWYDTNNDNKSICRLYKWSSKKEKNDTFETNPGLFLIRDCDRIIKETRAEYEKINEEKIDHYSKLSI